MLKTTLSLNMPVSNQITRDKIKPPDTRCLLLTHMLSNTYFVSAFNQLFFKKLIEIYHEETIQHFINIFQLTFAGGVRLNTA
jgi:hypothetical protein